MARATETVGKVMGKVKGARQALTGGAGIFERLATEHGEISTMIRRVAASTDDSDVRKELYPRIRSELLAHAKAEEKEVYSQFRLLPSLADAMDEAADEHHRIEDFFEQLDSMSTSDDRWISVFRDMMTLVQKHVMEEELQVFPKAKKELSKDQSEALESRYLDAKEDMIAAMS